jgi:hypothetical protein
VWAYPTSPRVSHHPNIEAGFVGQIGATGVMGVWACGRVGYRLSAIGVSAIGYRLSAIGYRLSMCGPGLSIAPGA